MARWQQMVFTTGKAGPSAHAEKLAAARDLKERFGCTVMPNGDDTVLVKFPARARLEGFLGAAKAHGWEPV